MVDLTVPEWSGPFATGLFGTAYPLGNGHSLVLVGAPGTAVGSRPGRTWGWVIMKGRPLDWQRDFAFEESLRANKDLTAATGTQTLDGDRVSTLQEKDLEKVLRILREVVRTGADKRPGRKDAV